MSIKYSIEAEEDLLNVTAIGTCENLIQLKDYLFGIHDTVELNDSTRVFVDESRLIYALSTIETFNSAKFVSKMAPRQLKIAVLCRREGWKETKFWEDVAFNRGVMVRVFIAYDEAQRWIRCISQDLIQQTLSDLVQPRDFIPRLK